MGDPDGKVKDIAPLLQLRELRFIIIGVGTGMATGCAKVRPATAAARRVLRT